MEYNELMQKAKKYANSGQLKKALKLYEQAREIDDNEKIQRRIQKVKVSFCFYGNLIPNCVLSRLLKFFVLFILPFIKNCKRHKALEKLKKYS